MQRAANFQARSAKNKMKPKKIKKFSEFEQGLLYRIIVYFYFNCFFLIGKFGSKSSGGKQKKGNSVFDSQFTDVSKSGVKKYRYE